MKKTIYMNKDMKRRLLLSILACCLVLTLSAQFGGGEGTADDPWLIATPEHLDHIRSYLGVGHNDKYYMLTNDIDLGVAPWNEGQGWVPIGSQPAWGANNFRGHFFGRGFVISNMTINRAINYVGLFGTTVDATIKDLGLKDVNVAGNYYVGGLIGQADGNTLVQTCYVTGYVKGLDRVSGLISWIADAGTNVFDCYSTATIEITTTTTTHYAAGLISYQNNGVTRRSYAVGPVIAANPSNNAGAIIGFLGAAATQSHLYWNTQTSNMTRGIGTGAELPGHTTAQLLMRDTYEGFDFEDTWRIAQGSSYPYLYWQGEEPDEHNLRPWLPVRNLTGTGANETVNLSWEAPFDDFGAPDGYIIYRDNERVNVQLIVNTQYQDTGLTNWITYNYNVTAVHGQEESLPTAPIAITTSNFAGGTGSAEDPFIVEDSDHLNGVRFFMTAHYRQVADIDLGIPPWNEELGWVPIGSSSAASFRGHYDGQDFVISNLTINRPANYQALFGFTTSATIKNVGLKDVSITGNNYVAGFVGYQNASLVQSCYVTGSITGINQVGGISSFLRFIPAQILDCYSNATIRTTATSTNHYVGGIVAWVFDGEVRRSYVTGTFLTVVPSTNVGAVIGNIAAAGVQSHLYWNTQTTNMTRGVGTGTVLPGQTTRQLTQRNTFEGFDFDNTWRIVQDTSYPYLQWQGEEPDEHNIRPWLPPRNLAGTGGNEVVNLVWDAPFDDLGAPDGYNVYRNNERVNEQLVANTQYQDTGLSNWSIYSYYVAAVHNGEVSLPSNTTSVQAVPPLRQLPEVTDVVMEQIGGQVIIDFGLTSEVNCDITFIISDDGGESYKIYPTPENLQGDIEDVEGGPDKQIVWNFTNEEQEIRDGRFRVRVIARRRDEPVLVVGGTYNNVANQVTLTRDILMGRHQITQEEFMAVMVYHPRAQGFQWPGNPLRPAEQVTWFDAIEYCNRRSMQEGLTPVYSYLDFGNNPDEWPPGWNAVHANNNNVSCDWNENGYRLPTEAEWEWAARGGVPAQDAGTINSTYSGSENIDEVSWHSGNSDNRTHDVGRKRPNELDIHDMSGNVLEWIWDKRGDPWDIHPSGINPTGWEEESTSRHWRGGAFSRAADSGRVFERGTTMPGSRFNSGGFRVVRLNP